MLRRGGQMGPYANYNTIDKSKLLICSYTNANTSIFRTSNQTDALWQNGCFDTSNTKNVNISLNQHKDKTILSVFPVSHMSVLV